MTTEDIQTPTHRGQEHRDPIPIGSDFDGECRDVVCKADCWLYQPEKGRCPYLET